MISKYILRLIIYILIKKYFVEDSEDQMRCQSVRNQLPEPVSVRERVGNILTYLMVCHVFLRPQQPLQRTDCTLSHTHME